MPADLDEAPFWNVYPKLKAGLSRIAGTAAMYEREPQGGPQSDDASDPEQDPPNWDAKSRSYHLFFLPLLDDRFRAGVLCFRFPAKEAGDGKIVAVFP